MFSMRESWPFINFVVSGVDIYCCCWGVMEAMASCGGDGVGKRAGRKGKVRIAKGRGGGVG
jgi:hypothetical protein